MAFVKIGALALAGVMLGILLKSAKQEYAIFLGIVVCMLIFSCTVSYMGQVKLQLAAFEKYISSHDSYFSLLFKVVGITWICEFVSGICKDSGYSAVAAQMELLGKIAVLFAGMPVFLALIETIAGFAG